MWQTQCVSAATLVEERGWNLHSEMLKYVCFSYYVWYNDVWLGGGGGSLYGELFTVKLATFPPLCATLPTALEGSTPRSRASRKRKEALRMLRASSTRPVQQSGCWCVETHLFHRIFFFFFFLSNKWLGLNRVCENILQVISLPSSSSSSSYG